MEIDYGTGKVKKWFEFILNDLEITNYLTNKEDLELLYNKITGKEIKQKEVQYFKTEAYLLYDGKKQKIVKNLMPHKLLNAFFTKEKNGEIMLGDIFQSIFLEEYSLNKHKNERKKIKTTVETINRGFRKISGGINLLQFKENVISKLL